MISISLFDFVKSESKTIVSFRHNMLEKLYVMKTKCGGTSKKDSEKH